MKTKHEDVLTFDARQYGDVFELCLITVDFNYPNMARNCS